MKYARIIDPTSIDTNPPRRALLPDERIIVGDLPADVLAGLGWWPLVETPEPAEDPPAGSHWEKRYARDGDTVLQSWAAVENPQPAPRSLSKRRLYTALKAQGIWSAVKQYMEGAGIWEDFSLATTLDEDDPLIVSAVAALKAALGLTDEQVAAIIDASVAGGEA